MSWLIKEAIIVPLAGDKPWFTGDIAVIDDKIAAVGENLTPEYNGLKKIPAKGFIAMPGLVNAHTHAAMNLFRGCGDDLPLQQWLDERVLPLEDKLTAKTARIGAMSAMLEMIRGGTTAFCDSYMFMDETAKAVLESGMRANLSRGLVDIDGQGAPRLAEGKAFVETWREQDGGGRIKCWLSPHAPYTCSDRFLQDIREAAADLGVGLNIHVSETKKEFNDSVVKYDLTPVERLNQLGIFDGVPVIASHCVWLGEDDRRFLAEKKVRIVHNPQSNQKLGSGVAMVPAFLAAGIPVALGTDGAASNNNLDMWEELRTAALLHKGERRNPTVLPAEKVLDMACRVGAEVIGFPECGTIEAGKKADLILVSLDQPNMRPLLNPISQLVYSAGVQNVDTVMIDGRLIMRKGEMLTLDEEKILYEVQKAADSLLG